MNIPSAVGTSVVVVTNQTSPYQVEFMNAVARDPAIQLRVVYLHSQRAGRQWVQLVPEHEHIVLDGQANRLPTAETWLQSADFAVISYYRDPFAAGLLKLRACLDKPWCFWGERMGVGAAAWAGPLARRWKLRNLHRSSAAIWGIGEFASVRYRREFGTKRQHCNLPYFSDLERFAMTDVRIKSQFRTVLFSGSLIKRKGVDIIAIAFLQVAPMFPDLRLIFVGSGEEQSSLTTQLRNCKDRVTFAGFQSWDALPRFYKQADLLCVPSRHDGWGLVVPEGLAAGLPVIGSNQMGAARELIHEGVNGWLVEGGNVQSLTTAMRNAASLSSNAMETMSQAAVASVANHQLLDGVRRFKDAIVLSLKSWHMKENTTAHDQ